MRGNHNSMTLPDRPFEKPNLKKTMSAVKKYLIYEQRSFILLVMLTIALTGFGLWIPSLISKAIDWIARIHTDKTIEDLAGLVLKIFVLYLIQMGLSYFEEVVSAKFFQNVAFRMREDYLKKITNSTVGFLDACRQGDLISRGTNDIEKIVKLLSETLMKLIASIILFVGISVIMVRVSWQLTIVCVCSMVITFLTAGFMGKFIRKHATREQTLLGSLNSYLEDCLNLLKSIKLYNRQSYSRNIFSKLSDSLKSESIYSLRWMSAVAPVNNLIGNLNFFAIALVGGVLAVAEPQSITVSSIVLFVLYVREYTETLNDFSEILSETQTAVAAVDRFFQILEAPEEEKIKNNNTIKDGSIDLEDIHFSYTADREVLSGVDMHIESGESIAIVGPSGTGKTTLIQLLLKFYKADKGNVKISGINIEDIPLEELRKNIIAIMQDDVIMEESLSYNLLYGTEDDIIANIINEFLNLEMDEIPDINHLSRGQMQKICFLRAFFVQAKILILDESMSLVDPITYANMFKKIRILFPKATIITITHQLSYLRECDRIYYIAEGRVSEKGKFKELAEKNGDFNRVLNIFD